jgi:Coenzyme PQQ synthesis protein D (PqqD)
MDKPQSAIPNPQSTMSNPDVVFRELDGEAVLLDLGSGTYFGLNVVGTRVWQMIEAGRSEAEMVDVLAAEYDAARARIAADVARLLDELRARRLITSERP